MKVWICLGVSVAAMTCVITLLSFSYEKYVNNKTRPIDSNPVPAVAMTLTKTNPIKSNPINKKPNEIKNRKLAKQNQTVIDRKSLNSMKKNISAAKTTDKIINVADKKSLLLKPAVPLLISTSVIIENLNSAAAQPISKSMERKPASQSTSHVDSKLDKSLAKPNLDSNSPPTPITENNLVISVVKPAVMDKSSLKRPAAVSNKHYSASKLNLIEKDTSTPSSSPREENKTVILTTVTHTSLASKDKSKVEQQLDAEIGINKSSTAAAIITNSPNSRSMPSNNVASFLVRNAMFLFSHLTNHSMNKCTI